VPYQRRAPPTDVFIEPQDLLQSADLCHGAAHAPYVGAVRNGYAKVIREAFAELLLPISQNGDDG
jgi:hypothetical protein